MQRRRLAGACAAAAVLVVAATAVAATSAVFHPFQAFPAVPQPSAVAIGDVTGDGRADVVVTNGYTGNPAVDFRLWVFPQTAAGTLAQTPVSYATAGAYTQRIVSLAVADITLDGRPDVVVGVTGAGVQVFPQTQAGTLGQPTLYATPDGRQVRVGRLNGDSAPDVAAIGWGTGSVSVLHNDGQGGLAAPVVLAAPHGGYDDLELGDVTGDGRDDIVVMSGQLYAIPNVSVLPQLPGGGFGAPASYSIGSQVLTKGIGIGDVTGDGRNDVVASHGGNRPSSGVTVFAQTATGTLAPQAALPSYDIPEPVDVADLDEDGHADVVTVHGGWLAAGVYRGAPGGGLGAEELYPLPYASHYEPHGLAIGDVTSDGRSDAVVADYSNGLLLLVNAGRPRVADVGVSLATSSARVKPRKPFWVDAVVANAGPDASAATLVVQLSGSVSDVTVADPACGVQGTTVTCSLAQLAQGAATTVRVFAKSQARGSIAVSAMADASVSDPNGANDQASAAIQVR